jgi:hypothetical protein
MATAIFFSGPGWGYAIARLVAQKENMAMLLSL